MKSFIISALSLLIITGCATANQYHKSSDSGKSLPADCKLVVLTEGQDIISNYKIIGDFSVIDTGLSVNCSEQAVKEKIRGTACIEGADAILYYNILRPSWQSTCYQARAKFYREKSAAEKKQSQNLMVPEE